MPEGDRSTVAVHAVLAKVVFFGPGNHDRGEGLVDLDEVKADKASRVRKASFLTMGSRRTPEAPAQI